MPTSSTTRPAFPTLTPISDHGESLRQIAATTSHPPRRRTRSSVSASEPSSPTTSTASSRSGSTTPRSLLHQRHRHKARSTASLADMAEAVTQNSLTQNGRYFIPSRVETPGSMDPPRYTSQSEGDGSPSETERDEFVWQVRSFSNARRRPIRTGQGTETEDPDDATRRPLPNARITSDGSDNLQPIIFQLLRHLSIVPAFFGSCYHLYNFSFPSPPILQHRVDSFVSLLFALTTLQAHLAFTTGLLFRWQTFYAPLAVLVRLLALQSICWPATHLTLKVLNHSQRPVVCWAVIGTTTCVSRSIQMWVTSNLSPVRAPQQGVHGKTENMHMAGVIRRIFISATPLPLQQRSRRWDWSRVLMRCGLPLGICYFVMAWGEVIKSEFG